MKDVTHDWLKSNYFYQPETGIFINKKNNKPVGYFDKDGYLVHSIRIGGLRGNVKLHRLAFLYMTGEIPKIIDHINRIRSDNRWCNLRPTTRSLNSANTIRKRSNDLPRGVSFEKRTGKFCSRIVFNRVPIHLGTFISAEEAAIAFKKKSEELFGEFSFHLHNGG